MERERYATTQAEARAMGLDAYCPGWRAPGGRRVVRDPQPSRRVTVTAGAST